eukprot:363096-Chlamydomonas_euryale.AAC.4
MIHMMRPANRNTNLAGAARQSIECTALGCTALWQTVPLAVSSAPALAQSLRASAELLSRWSAAGPCL